MNYVERPLRGQRVIRRANVNRIDNLLVVCSTRKTVSVAGRSTSTVMKVLGKRRYWIHYVDGSRVNDPLSFAPADRPARLRPFINVTYCIKRKVLLPSSTADFLTLDSGENPR